MINIRHITVLGSTGSIGVSTLDVVARHPDRFRVTALTANTSAREMLEQCKRFQPRYAVLLEEASADWLRAEVRAAGLVTEVLWGVASLEKVASLPEVDIVMAAIVGAAGIRPTFAAAAAGKHVLLANKETMVMAGRIFMDVDWPSAQAEGHGPFRHTGNIPGQANLHHNGGVKLFDCGQGRGANQPHLFLNAAGER